MPSREGGLRSLLAVRSDPPFDLAAVDPRATRQEKLYALAKAADDPRRVLVVLQAMDCGGKDGTIRSVAGTMNPQGLRIMTFGPPAPEELRHAFLWRVARAVPAAGFIGVFNRSHYEDVLIARVRGLVPEQTWHARYDEIDRSEAGPVDDGVTLLKVMLHIRRRSGSSACSPAWTTRRSRWKFNPADVDDRAIWADHQHAYGDALARCGVAAPVARRARGPELGRGHAPTRDARRHGAGLSIGYFRCS
ncbi:hypothetical protein GCM10009682_36800 [Luedemannella flava]|uniref:Polyphosphate kinase-2-related domain-containing protein n=1 Tax=Luedemannella flava TaxID=349316 RepID=A0ABP4YKL9_9ACTN